MDRGKWFTCTPKAFVGDESFFARDSGLLCEGFLSLGLESCAIMPTPAHPDDVEDRLIRTSFENLESAEWWKKLGGEGVVFYGWGDSKYRRIAKAIHEAGLILVTHMDTGGFLGMLNGPLTFSRSVMRTASPGLLGLAKAVLRIGYASTFGLIRNDLGRAIHLKQAHCIGAITPLAVKRIQKVCRFYGGEQLAQKVTLLPHPISPYMKVDLNVEKEPIVVAIGRWDDQGVKGTKLLGETFSWLLKRNEEAKIEIYGDIGEELQTWYDGLNAKESARVHLGGRIPNADLRHVLRRAQVSLCTSRSESFHIASAEALCCGCSVVGPNTPELPGILWFTDGEWGTAGAPTPDGLGQALLDEMNFWARGERSAEKISNHWAPQLNAKEVAKEIIELAATLKD